MSGSSRTISLSAGHRSPPYLIPGRIRLVYARIVSPRGSMINVFMLCRPSSLETVLISRNTSRFSSAAVTAATELMDVEPTARLISSSTSELCSTREGDASVGSLRTSSRYAGIRVLWIDTHSELSLVIITQSSAGILRAACSADSKVAPAKLSGRSEWVREVYTIIACVPSGSRSKGTVLTSLPCRRARLKGIKTSCDLNVCTRSVRSASPSDRAATLISSSTSSLAGTFAMPFVRA